MGQDLRHLGLGYAVILGALEMILEGAVYNALSDQGRNGHHGPELQRELILPGPNLTKEHVIIELGKLRGKLPKSISACCLLYHKNSSLFYVFAGRDAATTLHGAVPSAMLSVLNRLYARSR